ncbi:hypothetical protein BWGOE8_25680 [Bacillus mycoides]|uniref:RNA polymerase sigma-70 region 2 domain-containing protein n=2 Tax=Bacillus cereus group TaxID=86661 RepID=A0A2C1D3F8_BACCE|nr:hypothetical protein BWGOE9_25920 [Bacillus mycoides]OFD79118.1 hypothetical protein BWGOE8_25680 [Bacillus mycoides]OFD80856.1 hypothetical protein BWGOE10_26340 [Bacillus mycoides]PGS94941.1 hypothetical protein COD09_23770 [Bacillus cereus]
MLNIKSEERNVSDITFEELFKRNYVYVVKQILWIIKEQTIAEELAQEVFLQLYRTDWKEVENLRGWLIKSSTYVAYNYIRSEKRHQARVDKEIQYQEIQNDSSGLDMKSDGKINGQQEENPEYNTKNGMFSQLAFIQGTDSLPFELMAEGIKLEHVSIRDKDRPEGVITFVEGHEGKGSFKQPLTLDVNINKIGKVAGFWKGQIQIDPAKLKNKTN